jgi:hypothetical protein
MTALDEYTGGIKEKSLREAQKKQPQKRLF